MEVLVYGRTDRMEVLVYVRMDGIACTVLASASPLLEYWEY
jgi:hypothetical protein